MPGLIGVACKGNELNPYSRTGPPTMTRKQPTLRKGHYYQGATGLVYEVYAVNSSYATVRVGGDVIEISAHSELTEISEAQVQAARETLQARRAAKKKSTQESEGKQPGRSTTMTKKIYGHSAVSFCRYLGARGLNNAQGIYVCSKLKLEVKDSSVITGLSDGRSKSKLSVKLRGCSGNPIELEPKQLERVNKLIAAAPAKPPKKKAPAKKAAAKKAAPAKKAPAKKTAARKPITKESQVGKRKRTRSTKAAS